MSKPEWGQKRICQSCGAKFYDLQKDPAICPKCETVQVNTPVKSKRSPAKEATPVKPVEQEQKNTAEDDNDDLLLDTDNEESDIAEDDDTLMEDTSDISDDDDDMSEVKDHMEIDDDER